MDDCWIIIKDKVYDVTDFDDHPGGFDLLMDYAGTDATEGFYGGDENEHNHSLSAIKSLVEYCIGKVQRARVPDKNSTNNKSIINWFNIVILILCLAIGYYNLYLKRWFLSL